MKLVDILDGNGNSIVVDPIPTKAEVIAKFKEFIRELQIVRDGDQMHEAAARMAAMYRVAIHEMELIDRLNKKYRVAAEELGGEA